MRITPAAALLLAATFAPTFLLADDPKPMAPGLGDPGQLKSISIETGRFQDDAFVIAGKDASQQLIITGHYSSGQLRDLSGKSTFEATPEGIVNIDSTGHVTPVKEGSATVHVKVDGGVDATCKVTVTNIEQDLPINFANQISPIFTKYGCNGGGCHGKSGGQNGFALSLLGFEPPEDFEYLVKEGRGRRLFPGAPDRSLLLLKATGRSPHGGGHRFASDSSAYRLIRRWVEQGMPYGKDDDPKVVRIEVLPPERLMERDTAQQIIIVAHYDNGATEDVTRMTQFESNDTEMCESSVTGIVTTGQLTGSVAVMARYQGQVGVFRATIPLGIEVAKLPPEKNYVDKHVFNKLKALGLPSSEICDDASFLRRVTIDLAGRLPTLEEAEAFLADQDGKKREKLVDHLLGSIDYAYYFANKWSAILRNKRRAETDKWATYGFYDWIHQSLYENKPYDQFVREILASTGEATKNPTVAWYKEVKDLGAQTEDAAQLFLGLRIQCARCHHHPFEKWSQQDYYGFQAFFAQVSRKKGFIRGQDRIYTRRVVAQVRNPKSNQNVPATGLGSEPAEITQDDDARQSLVDWMAHPKNPFFSKALVNRYWKHFFGRGLVDPEDDMRVTNPASNPALLDALAEDFVKNKFDLKNLVRTITLSSTYQLSANPNEWNRDDKQNFSRYYPKRLNAEVLLDSINQVTGTSTSFTGVPTGTRAVQLPDNAFNSYFLTVFGRPEASSACECERSGEANLAQSLHLLNSSEIQGKLTNGSSNAARFATDKAREHQQKLRNLYLLAFSREPIAEELGIAMAHIEKHKENSKIAYEDIVWALINTKEFLFNH